MTVTFSCHRVDLLRPIEICKPKKTRSRSRTHTHTHTHMKPLNWPDPTPTPGDIRDSSIPSAEILRSRESNRLPTATRSTPLIFNFCENISTTATFRSSCEIIITAQMLCCVSTLSRSKTFRDFIIRNFLHWF